MSKSTVKPIDTTKNKKQKFQPANLFLLGLNFLLLCRWSSHTILFWFLFTISTIVQISLLALYLPHYRFPTTLEEGYRDYVFVCSLTSLVISVGVVTFKKKVIHQLLYDPYEISPPKTLKRTFLKQFRRWLSIALPITSSIYSTVCIIVLWPNSSTLYTIIHSFSYFIINLKLYFSIYLLANINYQLYKSIRSIKGRIQVFSGGPLDEILVFQLQRIDRCLQVIENLQNPLLIFGTIGIFYFAYLCIMFGSISFILTVFVWMIYFTLLLMSDVVINEFVFSLKRSSLRLIDLQCIVNNSTVLITYFTFLSRAHLLCCLTWGKILTISVKNIALLLLAFGLLLTKLV